MKKFIFISLLLIGIAFFPSSAFSQTGSATPTPESEEIDRLEKLKELIASTAAKKNLVERKGLIGKVQSVNGTQIVIEDHEKEKAIIEIDELTKFNASDNESFGLSDLNEGDNLSFVGLFNKETERLLARFVTRATNIPVYIDGGVAEKNDSNFTITVITEDGKENFVSVETSTDTTSYGASGMEESGYSKIEIGQRIIVAGFYDLENQSIITASRITHFTDLPVEAKVKKFLNLLNSESPVSTGSGIKLTPITE